MIFTQVICYSGMIAQVNLLQVTTLEHRNNGFFVVLNGGYELKIIDESYTDLGKQMANLNHAIHRFDEHINAITVSHGKE